MQQMVKLVIKFNQHAFFSQIHYLRFHKNARDKQCRQPKKAHNIQDSNALLLAKNSSQASVKPFGSSIVDFVGSCRSICGSLSAIPNNSLSPILLGSLLLSGSGLWVVFCCAQPNV